MDARQLRASLDSVGLNQMEFARLAGVDGRSVRRWADSACEYDVPDDLVRAIILPALTAQAARVSEAMDVLDEQEAQLGRIDLVRLPYYASADELEDAHPGESRTVGMANADARALAAVLICEGHQVQFVAPDEIYPIDFDSTL